MGKSVSSMGIFCLARLAIALADKNCDGLFIVNEVPALSLNLTIYFVNCAAAFTEKKATVTERR
jgi:hypothetical protein